MGAKLKLTGADNKPVELAVSLTAYASAAENKRDLRQEVKHLAASQGVAWDPAKGDLLDQMYVASGLMDSKFGGQPLNMRDLQKQELANGFRAPDGNDNSIGARLLFPQMILETMRENALDEDGSDILSKWAGLVATTTNVNGQRVDQPIINTKAPEESESQRIAQLAEPTTMVTITTGQKSYAIDTHSVGLLVSDQAREATTVDLVRIVMEAQARGQRIRNVEAQLKAMVLGDVDRDMTALAQVQAKDFDSAITTANTITKKAYLKWLRHNGYNANLTRVLTGMDEAILLDEQLTGYTGGNDNSKIVTPYAGVDFGIPTPEFTTFDSTLFGAGVFVGLDPRYAIQRFVNVSASYEAIEEYVMRRATGFRVDYGEMATRLYDEAWSVMNLSV